MASLINRGQLPAGVQSAIQTGAIPQQVTVSAGTPIIQATPAPQSLPQTTQAHVVQTTQIQGTTPIVQGAQIPGGPPFNTSHVPRGE